MVESKGGNGMGEDRFPLLLLVLPLALFITLKKPGSASGRDMIKRRSQSFSERRRSFSCFSSFTCFSSSRADISRAASRCFFLIRKRALAKVFRRRLSSSKASRFVSASACELPVFASFTRSDACAVEALAFGPVTDTSVSCFNMGEDCCCDSAVDGNSGFARLDSAEWGGSDRIGGSGC